MTLRKYSSRPIALDSGQVEKISTGRRGVWVTGTCSTAAAPMTGAGIFSVTASWFIFSQLPEEQTHRHDRSFAQGLVKPVMMKLRSDLELGPVKISASKVGRKNKQ